jgi:predicted  nucleic acid-binding Zn-ribbon protein
MSDKQDYIEKLKAQANVWRTQIAQLEARVDKAEVDAKHEYTKQLQQLQERVDQFEQKIDEIKKSSDDAYGELKVGAEQAWNDIGNAFSNALEQIK